jgi:hypothetical protein
MAVHRRTRRTTHQPDTTCSPTAAGSASASFVPAAGATSVHRARADRLRTTAHARIAAALSPRDQLTIAVDYVRAAEAAAFRADATGLDQLLTDAATDLLALGDELTAALDQQGTRR